MKKIEDIRKENLKHLIEQDGTIQSFAESIGKKHAQVMQWLKNYVDQKTGKPRHISTNSCRYIESKKGLASGWMDQDHSKPAAIKHDVALLRLVPIRGYAKLGGEENYFVDLQYPDGDGCIAFPTKDSDAYSVKCDGDSMSPRIRHGEYAIIEPNTAVMPGDEVLVQSKDGQVMVKVFTHKRDGRAYFESINDGEHKPFSLPLEEIDSMQYVAGIAKAALRVER